MATLYVKTEDGNSRTLQDVADAGIAGDFLVIRYNDGVVTFTKHYNIDDIQFDPTADQVEEADGESTNDTPDQ